jgi:hypothetical protein
MMHPDLYAVVAGLVAGSGSGLLFQWVSARITRVDFWPKAASLARSLVVVADDEDFLSRYVALLNLLMRYLGRQALTMALPLATVVTFAMLVLPWLEGRSNPNLGEGDSIPSRPITIGNSDLRPKTSDLAFFLPLCVGCGVAMIPSRRKE